MRLYHNLIKKTIPAVKNSRYLKIILSKVSLEHSLEALTMSRLAIVIIKLNLSVFPYISRVCGILKIDNCGKIAGFVASLIHSN